MCTGKRVSSTGGRAGGRGSPHPPPPLLCVAAVKAHCSGIGALRRLGGRAAARQKPSGREVWVRWGVEGSLAAGWCASAVPCPELSRSQPWGAYGLRPSSGRNTQPLQVRNCRGWGHGRCFRVRPPPSFHPTIAARDGVVAGSMAVERLHHQLVKMEPGLPPLMKVVRVMSDVQFQWDI